MAHFLSIDEPIRKSELFAGAGGGILGGLLLGEVTVCAVEWDPYCASALAQRQNDGFLDPFPIWDDVRTFDGFSWRGRVDLVSGGFPCQDISAAGKGEGITGERSGLWKEFKRIIGEVRPSRVRVENSPMLTLRGIEVVLGDLAALGYDAKWGVLGADDAGAPHIRKRIWIVGKPCVSGFGRKPRRRTGSESEDGHPQLEAEALADSSRGRGQDDELCPGRGEPWVRREDMANPANSRIGNISARSRREGQRTPNAGRSGQVSDTEGEGLETGRRQREYSGPQYVCSWWDADPADLPAANLGDEQRRERAEQMGREWGKEGDERALAFGRDQWGVESRVGRVAHGVAARVDRLKAIGNGQVPDVVVLAERYVK